MYKLSNSELLSWLQEAKTQKNQGKMIIFVNFQKLEIAMHLVYLDKKRLMVSEDFPIYFPFSL